MGINLSQSDDDVARQHRRPRVGHRDYLNGLHTYVPSGTQLPHASPYPSRFNIITLVRLSETECFLGRRQCRRIVPVVSPIGEWTAAGTLLTAFLSSSKALAHDSAATNLEMYHWIDTECRKPQMGTQCQRNQRMKGRILTPCCKCIARDYRSERAHLWSAPRLTTTRRRCRKRGREVEWAGKKQNPNVCKCAY